MMHTANRSTERTALCCTNGKSHGFTLIEIMVAMGIFLVVLGAIYGVFISSNKSYHTQDRVAAAQQGVRVGIDFMVRDIRMLGLDPLSADAGIVEATDTKILFTSDVDMDGTIEEENGERVTYEWDSGNQRLRRCLYEGTGSENWQTLINDVSAMTFAYLDEDDQITATLEDIRTVRIQMTCEDIDSQGQAFTRTLDTRIRCRNL